MQQGSFYGQTARLTNLLMPPTGVAWSPDGKQISFTALMSAPPTQIATMPAAPPGAKWAEPAAVIDKLAYRFNGAGYFKPGFISCLCCPLKAERRGRSRAATSSTADRAFAQARRYGRLTASI